MNRFVTPVSTSVINLLKRNHVLVPVSHSVMIEISRGCHAVITISHVTMCAAFVFSTSSVFAKFFSIPASSAPRHAPVTFSLIDALQKARLSFITKTVRSEHQVKLSSIPPNLFSLNGTQHAAFTPSEIWTDWCWCQTDVSCRCHITFYSTCMQRYKSQACGADRSDILFIFCILLLYRHANLCFVHYVLWVMCCFICWCIIKGINALLHDFSSCPCTNKH